MLKRYLQINILILIVAGVLIVGCGRMPVPTSPAPGAVTAAPTVAAKSSPAAAPSSGSTPSTNSTGPGAAVSLTGGTGNAANGAALFKAQPCSSCHDVTKPFPGGVVCPNLGNVASEADRILKSLDYHGRAKTAAEYVRESIVDPNAYIVPGATYHTADGQSTMPKNFATDLSPSQIDDLVAYLMTLK